MAEELSVQAEAAVEYDRAFAHVTRYFMPLLLRAADVTPSANLIESLSDDFDVCLFGRKPNPRRGLRQREHMGRRL